MTRRRTRRLAAPLLAAAGLAVVLAGCGTNGNTTFTTQTQTPAPKPAPAPTLPAGADPFTATDTPVDQAPHTLAAAWRAAGMTLIPGHETVDATTQWPPMANHTGGALDDGQVAALRDAVMRVQVLAAWSDEHDQVELPPHMMSTLFMLGPSGVALAEGTRVHSPDCAVYPSRLAVDAPAPGASAVAASAGQNVPPGDLPVVMSFTGPCTLTGTTSSGRSVVVDTLPAASLVVFVHLTSDPLLGPIAYLDAGLPCTQPGIAPLCGPTG